MLQEIRVDLHRRTFNWKDSGCTWHEEQWISFILVELLVIILTLIMTHGESSSICPFIVSCAATPATAQALQHVSIAPSSYVTYNLVLALLQSLIFFQHRRLHLLAQIERTNCSRGVVLFGEHRIVSFFSTNDHDLPTGGSLLKYLCPVHLYGVGLLPGDVSRWAFCSMVELAAGGALGSANHLLCYSRTINITYWPPALNAVDEVLSYGGTIALLIYRYVRVFSYSQPQQAKWLLFGFGGLFVLIILYDIGSLVPGLGAPDSLYLLASGTITTITFLLVPISVGIAILHFRLWEIDLIIRRTIIYSTLIVILVLIYVGLVFIFSTLLRDLLGQQQNPLVIVASTLVIAALFQPLRHGIQRVIDRRFYRRKYDATRTVEAFSATLRSEVDLSQLREHLLNVVQETMQPAHVSLWLRKSDGGRKPGRQE